METIKEIVDWFFDQTTESNVVKGEKEEVDTWDLEESQDMPF